MKKISEVLIVTLIVLLAAGLLFADYLVQVGNDAELVVSAPPALPGVDLGASVVLGWPCEAADVFAAPDGPS